MRARLALRLLLVALGVSLPGALDAQQGDSVVWVYLGDAAPGLAAPAAPAIGDAARARRARDGIPTFENDAPIPAATLAALETAGLRVRHPSRWLRAVSGSADAAALARLRALDFVERIVPVARLGAPPPVGPPPIDAAPPAALLAPPDSFYGLSLAQVRQLGVPSAHDLGFTGAGVRIAILDTGFDHDHEALAPLEVVARRDFIQGDTIVQNQQGDVVSQHNHGTQVWSVLGGHAPNRFIGPAYAAEFLLAKVDDVPTETRADEDRWVAALEWADSLGAQIVSSSLGYRTFDDGFTWTAADLNGDITPTTVAADEAARRGILVVNVVGNGGPQPRTLIAPADADSVLAVGAVTAAGTLASFSSRGPTADGRRKPNVVARGVQVTAASPPSFTGYVSSLQGTSFAAPLVAGGAALFLEAWPELGAMAALRALELSGSIQPPNDSMGYGIPHVGSAILFPRGIEALPTPGTRPGDQVTSLGQTFAWSIPVLHPAARPVTYRLQVSTAPSFPSVVFEEAVVDAQVLTLSRPLPSAPTLWWRVVAATAPGITRTSAAVGPISMPAWVRLVTLADPEGVFITDPSPLLVWDPLPAPPPIGPLTFDVEVFSASDGRVVQQHLGVTDTLVTGLDALPFNDPFRWRVIVHTATGAVDTVESAAPFVVVSSSAPPVTLLYQNFPNPFPRVGTPSTTIWFDLASRTRVTLAVYDLRGRLVRRLVPDARQSCPDRIQLDVGTYGRDGDPPCVSTTWDGTTDAGQQLPAGVYVIRLATDRDSYTVRTLYRP